jgi:DNA helicase HerA-like ATPase
MNPKDQNQSEKNLKTMQMLLESGLANNPLIGQILNGAISTGNFNEISHYLELNSKRLEAVSRMAVTEAYKSSQNPFYPFPAGPDELSLLDGPIKLGIINSYKGQQVAFGIDPIILTMHVQILGRTGSGKTLFMMNFLAELSKCINSA